MARCATKAIGRTAGKRGNANIPNVLQAGAAYPCQTPQPPVEVNVFPQIERLVIPAQSLEDIAATELRSALCHVTEQSEKAPHLQVGVKHQTPRGVVRIHSTSEASRVGQGPADAREQRLRDDSVSVGENKDITAGGSGAGIARYRNTADELGQDSCTEACCHLGRVVGTTVVNHYDLDRWASALEELRSSIACASFVSSIVRRPVSPGPVSPQFFHREGVAAERRRILSSATSSL